MRRSCITPAGKAVLESLESRLLLSVVVPGAISGTIVNAQTSQPVVGIEVNVFQSSNAESANDQAWEFVKSVSTNGSGQYLVTGLDPRHYRVEINDGAAAPGAAPNAPHYIRADLYDVVVFDNATTTNMNIRAIQAGWITGHVYNDAGVPIAHAQVLVDADYTQDSGDSWHWFETDANGRYDLYVAPTSKKIYPVEIIYAPSGVVSPDPEFHAISYAVQIAPGLYSAPITGVVGPDFHLSLGGTIHGFVVTADGAPVVDHDVLEPITPIANGIFQNPNARTDPTNGEFWLDGVPANTPIYLDTVDWNWNDFSSNGHMYAQGRRYVGPFSVGAGEVLNIDTLTVPRAGTIRGVVTDATGIPIVDATVQFIGIDANGGSVSLNQEDAISTDALGQYYCNWLPPGQYTVGVLKDGWVPYAGPTTITVTSDNNDTNAIQQDVVLQSAAGGVQVSGTITNFLDFAPKNSDGVVLPFDIVDYGGYLQSEQGPEGPMVLAYSADKQWTPADMIQPDRTFTAMANATDGYKDYFQTSATPAGRYAMILPTGAQTVQALGPAVSQSPGEYWSAVLSDPVTIDGKAGQSLTNAFTIPKGTATISGDITFPLDYGNGGVISESSTFLFLKPVTGNNSFFGRAVGMPDATGHYVLANIPVGNYYLYAYGLGLTPWISDLITVATGQGIDEDVAMSYGGIVSGTVTDDGGAPVAGAAVSSRNTGFSVITEADGTYQLPGFLVGSDTLTVSRADLVPQSVDVTLAANEEQTQNIVMVTDPSSITGLVKNAGRAGNGIDDDGDGVTDEADEALVSGATVVAYNTVTKQQVSTTTVAGEFTFTGLAPGTYVLGANADGMTTATYPGGAGTIALAPDTDLDLGTLTPDHIELAYIGPSFSVSSSVAAGKLSITFHTDMALKALPTVTLVGGAGTLGSFKQVNTTTFTCTYTPAASDTAAQVRIAESATNPVVPGSPAGKTFAFDVAATLIEQEGTTFYNAEGAAADMMGAQDNSTVYVPPFALAGTDATSAITLTASRYGDPGAQLGDSKAVTGVYEFNFTKDGQATDVHLAHDATVTLSFKLPVGMTPAEFEATIRVGFKNESHNPPEWVWNDLANSNPDSGISDIRINWASNTITFKASHFTPFAAAIDMDAQTPLDVTTTGLPVIYTDSDGTKVTVSLPANTAIPLQQAVLHFTGIGMTKTTTSTGITVSGSSLKLDTVTLSNTSVAVSSLKFTTVGGHFAGTAVGAITGSSLNLLDASTVTLDGAGISIPAGEIKTVKLANIDNGADITMGAAAAAVTITCGAIGDGSSISVTGPIQSLTATRWDSGELTAYSLTTLKVTGAFGADVSLTGAGSPAVTLGTATISGGVNGTTWGIDGNVSSITISGTVANWTLAGAADGDAVSLGKITTLSLGDVDDTAVTASGAITTLKALDWDGGSIAADSIGTFSILGRLAAKLVTALPGDFRNADLTLSGASVSRLPVLGTATVAGTVDNSVWLVHGAAGAITVGVAGSAWKAGLTGNVTSLTCKGDFGSTFSAGNLGPVSIVGNMQDALLLAGADLGDDAQPDGSDASADVFAGGNIASFKVVGSVSESIVATGLDPADGVWHDGDDFFPSPSASNVKSFTIGHTADSNSYFAGTFPKSVSINGRSVDPLQSDLFLAGTGPITLSTKTAAPGTLLTITGHFNVTADTKVVFVDADGNTFLMTPPGVSATSIQVRVPVLFDASGNPTAGFVSVTVRQEVAAGHVTSAPLPGLAIRNLPTTGLQPGQLTNAYLTGMETMLAQAIIDYTLISLASGGLVDVTGVVNNLQDLLNQYVAAQQMIAPILADPTATVEVGEVAGTKVVLDLKALDCSDRMIAELILGRTGAAPTLTSSKAMMVSASAVPVAPEGLLKDLSYFFLEVFDHKTPTQFLAEAKKASAVGDLAIQGMIGVGIVLAPPLAADIAIAGAIVDADWWVVSTWWYASESIILAGAADYVTTGKANWARDIQPALTFLEDRQNDLAWKGVIKALGGLFADGGEIFEIMLNSGLALNGFFDPIDLNSVAAKIKANLPAINAFFGGTTPPSQNFNGTYDGTLASSLSACNGPVSFTVTNGNVSDSTGSFVGTVASNGHFTGTWTTNAMYNGDPPQVIVMPMSGTFSTTAPFTISGSGGGYSATISHITKE